MDWKTVTYKAGYGSETWTTRMGGSCGMIWESGWSVAKCSYLYTNRKAQFRFIGTVTFTIMLHSLQLDEKNTQDIRFKS